MQFTEDNFALFHLEFSHSMSSLAPCFSHRVEFSYSDADDGPLVLHSFNVRRKCELYDDIIQYICMIYDYEAAHNGHEEREDEFPHK